MKTKLISVMLAAFAVTAVCFSTGDRSTSAEQAFPLIYEAEGKLSENERLTYVLPEEKQVQGNALSVKVFLKNTYNYALPVRISVCSGGTEYTWNSNVGTARGIEYTTSDGTGEKTETGLQWNRTGELEIPYMFYGEILLPFSELQNGAGAAIESISEISVTVVASVNSNFASGDTWLKDGISLYLFGADCVTLDEYGTAGNYEPLANFCGMNADEISVEAGTAVPEGVLRTATEEDYSVFEAFVARYHSECETRGDMKLIEGFDFGEEFSAVGKERSEREMYEKFYLSGQNSDYSIKENGERGNGLFYNLDSADFDAGKNSYAGVHFNFGQKDATDWSGANGIAVYVENKAEYLVSFALELFQYNLETGLLEQYNLNDVGQKYKTVYAYDTQTGEEFSYHTQTFVRIPAGFKGWLRIPFSQYAAPSWSLSPSYGNEGILDFDKNPVVKISITRLFNANQDTEILLDNISLYYGDFSVGNLFDDSRQSIKDCMENGSVPA